MPLSREAVVARALELEGLSFGLTRDRYCAELYPLDTKADALSMGSSQESCGLTCEAILRPFGIASPLPYVASFRTRERLPAVVWQREEAKKRGAWVDALKWGPERQLPILGDMVEITGPAHVLTIVGGERFDCESIDGGQPDAANFNATTGQRSTAIRRRVRRFDERPGELWLVCPGQRDRRVVGWIDVSLL